MIIRRYDNLHNMLYNIIRFIDTRDLLLDYGYHDLKLQHSLL